MSPLRLILRSLVYYRRTHLAVALGVAAGTAVLAGALVVGDSMRGSLRDLTLKRLGRIDEVLLGDRFFPASLADDLAANPKFQQHFTKAAPAILLKASLENADPDNPGRANQVQVIGCDRRLWEMQSGMREVGKDRRGGALPEAVEVTKTRYVPVPKRREIVLNAEVARQLEVTAGDAVLLRLPRPSLIPADSALGRKRDTVLSLRIKVAAVVRMEGLARFSLRPSQHVPRNAMVELDWLADRLDRPSQANAILVAGQSVEEAPPPEADDALARAFQPSAVDLGVQVRPSPRGGLTISSDRLLLERPLEEAIEKSLRSYRLAPALTYLANTIACGETTIPYSTVTGIDLTEEGKLAFGEAEGEPTTDEAAREDEPARADKQPVARAKQPVAGDGDAPAMMLNRWAADDLGAKPGDTIRLTYFLPETMESRVEERTEEFRLAAVVPMDSQAADPTLMPEVPGVTDKLEMGDWDPPFPFDAERIRDKDETYWEDYRGTPKACVSLAVGRELWASRFGRTTSIRVLPPEDEGAEPLSAEAIASQLEIDPEALGLVFQPVKRQGLEASKGTTSFNLLFLGFSMFLIASAVMLVALLFRLGIDARAEQLGLLAAVGFSRRRVSWLLIAEGLVVAALGSLLGVAGGIGYAWLMIAGLRTLWLAAVVTPFLELHWQWSSLAWGYASGLVAALAATAWAVWRSGRASPRKLLAGEVGDEGSAVAPARRGIGWDTWLAAACLAGAIGLGALAMQLRDMAQAGAFFGAGALVLAAAITLVGGRLRAGRTGPAVAVGRGNLARLALRNAARNPARSTLTIGLVAAASFVIVAISAFRLDPRGLEPNLDSGNGGFALVAQSTQPIYQDLDTRNGRTAIGGFTEEDERLLSRADFDVTPLRVKPGDDASCLNLYQPRQPRVLAIPEAMIRRDGFRWASSLAQTPEERENPWVLLQKDWGRDAEGRTLVPVVLESDMAQYSLHKGLGEMLDIRDGQGRPLRLKIVGLLTVCILHGDLLMAEGAFEEHFPEVSGHRFFLIECDPELAGEVAKTLRRVLGDYGLAVEPTGQRLAAFMAVQNTYLSTFQTVGGLGLLLGTFGLAAVQLRNVLERRRELALLRAAGFRRAMLAALVTLENATLLVAGLGCGAAAALVAVLPHLFGGRAIIPWWPLAGTLGLVLAVGLLAGLAAVRATLRAPLLESLRGE